MLSLFAGCAKEAPVNTNTSTPKDEVPAETKQVVTLFADVEQFTSESGATPQSKAIADDGFSWQEGDQIAIPATGVSGGYAIFTYDTEKGKFVYELTGSESFVDGTAYYPANSRPEGGYSSDFANADSARKGFKMTAEYTAGANSIAFHHTGAMVELHFTNVPSFASTVRVKIGEASAATVALSSPTSTVTVKVPVPAASSSTYSFALLQGENIIREVSKSATLYAGKYYDTPEIAIGHIIKIVDDNKLKDSSYDELAIWQTSNSGSHNYRFKMGNSYPSKLNLLSDYVYYVVLNTSETGLEWATDGVDMGVSFEDYQNGPCCTTSCVYLYRDFTFTPISGQGLKTDYRIYAKLIAGKRIYWGTNGIMISETYQTKFSNKDMTWLYGDTSSNEEAMYYYDMTNGGDYFYWNNLRFYMWNPDNLDWNREYIFPDGGIHIVNEVMVEFS